MAYFRGTLRGARGEASRLGHKSSGLYVTAASWQGAIHVSLYERGGVDYAEISFAQHYGAGVNRIICDVPISGAPVRAATKRVRKLAEERQMQLDAINDPRLQRGRP